MKQIRFYLSIIFLFVFTSVKGQVFVSFEESSIIQFKDTLVSFTVLQLMGGDTTKNIWLPTEKPISIDYKQGKQIQFVIETKYYFYISDIYTDVFYKGFYTFKLMKFNSFFKRKWFNLIWYSEDFAIKRPFYVHRFRKKESS